MKARINLFKKTQRESIPMPIKRQLYSLSTLISLLFFLIFIAFILLTARLYLRKKSLLERKQAALLYLLENKSFVSKMAFFSEKTNQLRNYSTDDAQFLPYYNHLKNALTLNVGSFSRPVLENMTMNKDRSTTFTVRFTSYDPALEFITYVESDAFLTLFENLELVGFTLDAGRDISKTGYQLQFRGTFAPIIGNG